MKKLLEELEEYLDSKSTCIVCNSKEFENYAKQGYFNAMKCRLCGMISVNPHYTEEGLDRFYSTYYENRKSDPKLSSLRKDMYIEDEKWITNYIKKGKVLDVGCSDGSFLNFFDKKHWNKFGIDLTSDALEVARRRGISTFQGKIWETDVGNDYDLLMMRGVVEHFKDPITALKKCVSVLKTGGLLYITATPNGDSFAFNVYRHKWGLFTPYEHIHFFSINLLTKVLKTMGMELVSGHHQYEETPYKDIDQDFKKIIDDIIKIDKENSLENIEDSPAFPGSMLTAVWKKK